MKVDIKRTERARGLFSSKKYFVVTVTVLFTSEEMKGIEMGQLGNYILVKRPPRAGVNVGDERTFHLRVGHLVRGTPDKYEFEEFQDAEVYNLALIEKLTKLKQLIQKYLETPKDQSFEI